MSLTLLVVASSVFASSIWNNASNDCPTVAIANYTTNTGYTNPCWPLSTVNANPGDSVNVRVYYHNTSNQNATNVRVSLNTNTGSSTSHSFSGQITSDQGNISFGPVVVNLPSSQGISFGSTRWYPNQTQTQTTFLNNQDGGEVLSGGLNIGTIAPGWNSQGSVVISFYINKPQPTGTINANPNSCTISSGSSTCSLPFTWSTSNPVNTSTVLNNSGSVIATNNNGSQSFNISFGNSIYKLFNNNLELDSTSVNASCSSNSNWDGNKCVVPVNDCFISSFSSNKTNVPSGDPVILSWSTNYCNSVNISGVGTGLSSNGSITIYPTNTITYTLTGFGDTNVTPTKNLEIIAGGPVYAPGFPAGAPGYSSKAQ